MSVTGTNTICGICTKRCLVRAETENGTLCAVKPVVEKELRPYGAICLRGLQGAAYEYRPDRLLYPMKRVGPRGSGQFARISWEEAIQEITVQLQRIREASGPDAVAFFSGYSKWYRPMLRRLAVAFGSVNYGTESSSCHRATVIASRCDSGFQSVPDYHNAKILLTYARANLPPAAKAAKKRGMKILVIDSRTSRDIEHYADLHLRPIPGTDAALAAGLANALILRGAADEEYLAKYTHGYEEYRAYVSTFTPEKTEAVTGVRASDIQAAADLIASNLPMSTFDGFTGAIHHRNGVQIFRAWEALNVLTGCYARPGGNHPIGRLQANGHVPSAYREFAFSHPYEPAGHTLIGESRYPLWAELLDECQAMEFPTAVRDGKLKAIFALGMNARMFPDSNAMFRTLDALDFFVDCDLWMSDTARHADLVLPVCTSYEREQIAVMMNGGLWYNRPVVTPCGEARSDEDILIALAEAMDLHDPLLRAGKEACYRFLLEETGITLEELKARSDVFLPNRIPAPDPLQDGFYTPTGKYEFYSERIAKYSGLSPLPTHLDPFYDQDRTQYPLILMAGVRTERYAYAIHSRTHTVPELRQYHPDACVDLHPDDASARNIQCGDTVRLETAFGSLVVRADWDADLLPGTVNMFHGMTEADVNTLIPGDYLDPYSGFPGYKAIACQITKI